MHAFSHSRRNRGPNRNGSRGVPVAIAFACGLIAISGCRRGDSKTATKKETAANQQPAIPERIIALAPNAAEIICGLGACDRLVGVSSFCTYPPELANVPKIGGG